MDKKNIATISEGLAGVTSAAIASWCGEIPGIEFITASLPPFLSRGYKTILDEFLGKNLIKRECERLQISFKYTCLQIEDNQKKGYKLRDDTFDSNSEKVENIIEGVLKKLLDDTEQQKSRFYGYFIANLPYSPEIDYYCANFLQNTIRKLSFRQLCLIRYYHDNTSLDVSKWGNYFESGNNTEGFELYAELLELKNLNLIKKMPPYSVGADLEKTKLSQSGEALFKLMGLEHIEYEDIAIVSSLIDKIKYSTQ